MTLLIQYLLYLFDLFYARFEETNNAGGSCKTSTECIGGFSRLYHEIMRLKTAKPDSIILNGGDSFQGTIWYSVGKWNVTQEFMNTLPIDAEVGYISTTNILSQI